MISYQIFIVPGSCLSLFAANVANDACVVFDCVDYVVNRRDGRKESRFDYAFDYLFLFSDIFCCC